MSAATKSNTMTYVERLKNISNDGALFVLNKTEGLVTSDRGALILTVRDGIDNVPVSIPATWAPVDLSLQATPGAIKANPAFRSLVSRGLIEILTDTEAQELLSSPRASAEAERNRNKVMRINEGAAGGEVRVGLSEEAADDKTNNIGFDLINRFKARESTEDETVLALKGIAPILKDDQISFLLEVKTTDAINKALLDIIEERASKKNA